MNRPLQREIVRQALVRFGSEGFVPVMGFPEPLCGDRFLIPKQVVFENDAGEKFHRNVWAAVGTVGISEVRIISADTSETVVEKTAIVQLDSFPPYALRWSDDSEPSTLCTMVSADLSSTSNCWAECDTLMQAKFLVGIESLTEMRVSWQPMSDFQACYQCLVGFLNSGEEQ